MSDRIAALPMYDFAELRTAHDTLWRALSAALIDSGIQHVPLQLTRDTPYRDLWRHPALLFGQACEYPIAMSLGDSLTLVATPRYSASGCEGTSYRSAIIVRADDPTETLAELKGRRCVVNEMDSNSGMNLLRAAVAPFAYGASFFGSLQLSGSHHHSVELVAQQASDVAAIDCVTFAHLQRLQPELARKVRILGWTPPSPSLPFVTSRATDEVTLGILRATLGSVVSDTSLRPIFDQLLLDSVDLQPDTELTRLRQLKRGAEALGYAALM